MFFSHLRKVSRHQRIFDLIPFIPFILSLTKPLCTQQKLNQIWTILDLKCRDSRLRIYLFQLFSFWWESSKQVKTVWTLEKVLLCLAASASIIILTLLPADFKDDLLHVSLPKLKLALICFWLHLLSHGLYIPSSSVTLTYFLKSVCGAHQTEAWQPTHLHWPPLCVYKSNQRGWESERAGEGCAGFFGSGYFQNWNSTGLFLDPDPGRECQDGYPPAHHMSLLFRTQKVK